MKNEENNRRDPLRSDGLPQRAEPQIVVDHVVYEYPAVTADDAPLRALDGISLEIASGEFLAVLGHNGSGKSTLAKLLNAQMTPTQGRITILGMDTAEEEKLWDIRSHCGIVFQNPDNQMVASVIEEDVAFGPENLGIPNPELRDRVDEALRAVGMYEHRRRAPHELSGGQKQRVAIAGVLAMRPDCIIMDEPTAMLDPIGRREILNAIHYLHEKEHKTILLITHNMEEAACADRVVVLHRGHIALEGTPRKVFSRVAEMRRLALDVPQVTELGFLLHQAGLAVPPDVLSVEELLEALA
uniref:energy-coupling factor transporter ATPase n=1 Tax=Ndongobacter massiliensis TaxID=1871025 RepID=UPI000A6A4971